MIILGISLGTATTGIAVLDGGELVFWHTHSFRDRWSSKKATKIASCYEAYVSQYKPYVVLIKVPPIHHHTAAIKQLLKKASTVFEYHGCMVEYKTKEDVKAVMQGVHNHNDLMKYAIAQYPILEEEYTQALATKQQYHAKVFDAVMVAHHGKIKLRNKSAKTTSQNRIRENNLAGDHK